MLNAPGAFFGAFFGLRLFGIVGMPGTLDCLPHLLFKLHVLPLIILLGARKNIPYHMLLHPVFAITTR